MSQKIQYHNIFSSSTRPPRSTAQKPASDKQEQFIGPMPLPAEFKSPSASIDLSPERMSIMSNILSTMTLKNQDERISGLMKVMSEEDLNFIMDDVVEQIGPSKCESHEFAKVVQTLKQNHIVCQDCCTNKKSRSKLGCLGSQKGSSDNTTKGKLIISVMRIIRTLMYGYINISLCLFRTRLLLRALW